MNRKVILIIFLVIPFLSCDSDFRQGRCDEGYFEQADGTGGSFCVPITEEGVSDYPESDSYDQNEPD